MEVIEKVSILVMSIAYNDTSHGNTSFPKNYFCVYKMLIVKDTSTGEIGYYVNKRMMKGDSMVNIKLDYN